MKTKQNKITTRLVDSFGNSMVQENILLSCNISFNPLLRKSSSRSLKCSERNWPMYSLLRLTLVQEWKRIQGVLDNRAWIRILPSSFHDIFYTFKQIIQFKRMSSYPKVDMYHSFYLKILIENLHQIQFFKQEHRKQRSAAPTPRSSENQFNFGHCNTKTSYKTIKKSLHGK